MKREQLQSRIRELEDALEFYADPMTYFAIGFFPDAPCGEFIEDGEPFDHNMQLCDEDSPHATWRPGKRARAALRTVAKKERDGN
jgi:hypothetical protein